MNDVSAKIVEASQAVFSSAIEGWVGDRIYQIIDFANGLHDKWGISGDIAEIGSTAPICMTLPPPYRPWSLADKSHCSKQGLKAAEASLNRYVDNNSN